MKQKILIFSLFILFSLSCTTIQKKDFPYNFVSSKTETNGTDKNQMDLYTYSGIINSDSLKMFCEEKRNNFNDGIFYFLVIFDSKENAIFPTTPFTAEYGIEENSLKHIKAFFTYNRLNGYCKLEYFEKNKWESKAMTIDF